MNVSYQGIKGAYSYIASHYLFPEAELLGKSNFRDVYESLVSGQSQAAVLPIDNTVIGSIFEVYDLLFEHTDVEIVGELNLKIDHNLVGIKSKELVNNQETENKEHKPETLNIKHQTFSLSSLREIYSHEKALKQCQKVFEQFPQARPVVWEDTAAAAAYVSLKHDPHVAAIASKTAAKLYGLDILGEKVQDNDENYTRFAVLKNRTDRTHKTYNDPKGSFKTSLVFAASHTPGSLMECMQPFAKAGLNLTKIQSRPLIGKPWQYLFYLDFLHQDLNGRLANVLKQVEPHTQVLRNLGTYLVGETISETV